MAKAKDTEVKKVIVSRRTDNVEYENRQFKDFVKQAGYVIINGEPKMKNYTVLLNTEVELPVTIIKYIKDRKVPKASSVNSSVLSFVNEFSVETVEE